MVQQIFPKEGTTAPFLQWSFSKKMWNRRLLLALGFVVSLTLFLYYREVRVDHLELNEVAKKYVLAQVSFEFPDVEATTFLKQEVVRDVGHVFRIDDKQILEVHQQVEKYLKTDSSWRKKIPEATFDQIYAAKEALRELLLKVRFVDARTLQKIRQLKFPTDLFLFFSPKESSLEGQPLPLEICKELQALALPDLKGETLFSKFVLEYAAKIPWHFTEDLATQNSLRQAAKNSVCLKHTKIEAGDRIINAGEKVTPRHLDMMKAMKKKLSAQSNIVTPRTVLGELLMSSILTFLCIFYLKYQQPEIFRSFRKTSLLVFIVILTLLLAKSAEYFFINKSGHFVSVFCFPLFVPLAALLSCLLLGAQIAFITSGFLGVALGITLAIEYDQFMVANLVASFVGIFAARKVRRRKEVFEVCLKMWLTLIPVMVVFNLIDDVFWNVQLVQQMVATLIFTLVIATLVTVLLPVLESTFDIVTNMTLMEYHDPNHPLVRRLSTEAPGTYQHSLVLGSLAETAALAIGANGLFCRVASVYHDIGKLSNPQYFTENQFSGFNVHQLLTPLESAQVILAHVADGVALAQQHKLPRAFIEVIREHHGTSRVYCFYHAQIQLMGDVAQVDETCFRYAGPKPRTKESAIIMLADSVEAAFRALEEISEQNVAELVERLVTEKIETGQLDDCRLTFEELGVVKKTIIRTLLVTRHARIKYPERRASSSPSPWKQSPQPQIIPLSHV